MWKRELIRNKIYAVLMVLASLPVVILERDGMKSYQGQEDEEDEY